VLEVDRIRDQIVQISSRIYENGFISGCAGNVSARLGDGRLLVTPSGVSKGDLSPEIIITLDKQGVVISALPGLKPTSEIQMHLGIYQRRPDIAAVIHAHPVACIALSLVGIDLDRPLIPEAIVMLGSVPTVPYATPSSDESWEILRPVIDDHNAIILAHHGSVTVGRDLLEAYYRLEVLEHTARIIALAHQLGEPKLLSQQDINNLF
jgi:L-fuculose-phosphate aldolase